LGGRSVVLFLTRTKALGYAFDSSQSVVTGYAAKRIAYNIRTNTGFEQAACSSCRGTEHVNSTFNKALASGLYWMFASFFFPGFGCVISCYFFGRNRRIAEFLNRFR